uniref:Coiled-coil serine rich protein 1 n=1 Tax=Myripristis murdjan TaxID=586833 RepID=A0A667WY43_9TELE
MGESGSRRSTLVSRLPIFRRSSSKRQDSLPSSPSSGGVGNGVHTSSPSSTNSSSGSTGKRRGIFRTPSLSFTGKRNSEPRVQPINLNLTPPLTQSKDANGNNQQTVTSSSSTGFSEGGGRPKTRHSFGFGSHRQKKIPRSRTEDFDKASSSSSTTNRNVFINCISSSGANEGDDSGFLDDYSGGSNNNKRSSRQKKQLLPKSFSAHHRFSRSSDHHRPPEVNLEPPTSTTVTPGAEGLTPGSWPGELQGAGGESSLQSPMISEDRTTAITPSEFIPITEDSVSEVDALPTPSPGSGLAPGPAPVPGQATDSASPNPPPAPENFSVAVSTSQVENICWWSHGYNNLTFIICLLVFDFLAFFLSPPASLCSSVSPYHEVMRMERRLRSSSEGAGGPRIHGNHRDAPGIEGCGLLKHRNNSSSSKLGSLVGLKPSSNRLVLTCNLSLSLSTAPSPYLHPMPSSSREPSRPTSLLPAEWSSGLGLGRDDEPLPPGLETLPLRLMQQDCTAVKTLLLRLRRTLQEVGGEHLPPSQIPRAVGAGGASASSSLHSLASRASPCPSVSSSDRASPPPPTPSSTSSASSSSSTFTGRLGQPPRGPLSLHSYSRKNVFLQHSLHTAELQALAQRDS